MAEILQGDTAAIGLFAVIQLAEGEALSGRLVLPRGEVALHLGNVVGARFGAVTGVDALYEHLLWRGGRFVFEDAPVPAAPGLGPAAALMLEGCRLLDEWQRVEGLVLACAPDAAPSTKLAPLVPHLDGRRRVRDAVARAGMLRCHAVDPLLDGLDAALLVERAVAVEEAPADDFDALMDAGRRHVRAGRHADALAAFRRAVALRPDDRVATQNLRRIAALTPS